MVRLMYMRLTFKMSKSWKYWPGCHSMCLLTFVCATQITAPIFATYFPNICDPIFFRSLSLSPFHSFFRGCSRYSFFFASKEPATFISNVEILLRTFQMSFYICFGFFIFESIRCFFVHVAFHSNWFCTFFWVVWHFKFTNSQSNQANATEPTKQNHHQQHLFYVGSMDCATSGR